MAAGIDYSRFDGIGDTSSEDEGQDEGQEEGFHAVDTGAGVPVYKLSGPGDEYVSSGGARVRFGGGAGRNIVAAPAPAAPSEGGADGTGDRRSPSAAGPSGRSCYRGDSLVSMSVNGAIRERYAWSQDKAEVVVSFFVAAATRAKDIRVVVDPTERRLTLTVGERLAFDGVLAYPVKGSLYGGTVLDAGIEHEDGGDWELRDVLPPDGGGEAAMEEKPCRRVVRVTLRKESPGTGIIVWWAKVFGDGGRDGGGDEPIDTTKISDRRKRSSGEKGGVYDMEKTWNDAQSMFRDRVGQLKEERQVISATIQGQQQKRNGGDIPQ